MVPAEGLTSLSPGALIAGKYLLVRRLAAGGMGAVWVAQHQQLDVPVAVKFMDPSLAGSPELRARFEREAKAAARLRSRHVVQVLDHGVDRETPYIVMELLDGEDLRSYLKNRRLDLDETADLLDQIARGLATAHAAGVVHRDLKPANIFLTTQDDERVVKILDFGVAKLTSGPSDGNSTTTGVVVGSPNFMSPEQARSTRSVDHRSDLWSLAVILYRCVSGRPPFSGENAADVIVKICAEAIPNPSEYAPELPETVDAFFLKALERNPDLRFQSALELAKAFRLAANAGTTTLVAGSTRREAAPIVDTATPDWGQNPLPLGGAERGRAEAAAQVPGPIEQGDGTLTLSNGVTQAPLPRRTRIGIAVGLAIAVAVALGVALTIASSDQRSHPDLPGTAAALPPSVGATSPPPSPPVPTSTVTIASAVAASASATAAEKTPPRSPAPVRVPRSSVSAKTSRPAWGF